MALDALLVLRVCGCAFFAVCFLQSGLDKVWDWKGNVDWLTGHFGKTFLRSSVPLALAGITMLELASGVLCGVGAVALFWGMRGIGEAGLCLSLVTLLLLFAGQRIAKEYVGAASLAGYFAVAVLALLSLKA